MRSNTLFSRVLAPLLGLALLGGGLACDDRTAEEKGREYADEKIGFAEGAAKVLEEKGKDLGTSAAKGVGDMVKGAGSAAKDAIHPPVKVVLSEGLSGAGLKLREAHEGETTATARKVQVSLAFALAFPGRLSLTALGEDGSTEIARATTPQNLEQAPDSEAVLDFHFPPDTRLSKVARYRLDALAAKTVSLAEGLAADAFSLSQLKEDGSRVVLYVVFDKAFRGGLQLRAADAGAKEVGRSEATAALKQAADSATFLTFDFDPRTPLPTAAAYTLHKVAPKKADPAK